MSGSEAGRPEAFLAPEVQPRYNLALHELLQAENKNEDFAELIRRESVGGFDIDAAAQEAGADSSIKARSIKEYKDFEKARKRLRDLRAHEEDLQNQERELEGRRRDEQEEREAGRLRQLYERLESYSEHSRRIEEIEAELSTFPGALEEFSEADADQAREIEKRISELEEGMDAEERAIEERTSDLAELSFEPPEDFKTRLDAWQEKVERLKQRLNERQQFAV
jgi:chromosome segregation ATPase